ncbi:MAG: hypothetical protein ABSG44_05690 [Thermodesulfobacteriota bacterium]|jgi:hypothetical protein
MVVYKVFYKNYELKQGEFVGLLVERRKDLRGKTQLGSGLKWARLTFGCMVRDSRVILVIPSELKPGSDAEWLMERGVFTRGELLGMITPIDQEMKVKGEGVTYIRGD